MKNNISYYKHETTSHNSWKFKQLRRAFGWAGEGKFWALNNMIADLAGCRLDSTNNELMNCIAADLDFNLNELKEYIEFLTNNVQLLYIDEEIYITNKRLQETLDDVMSGREKEREKKRKQFSPGENANSPRENQNSPGENAKNHGENEQNRIEKNIEEERRKENTTYSPKEEKNEPQPVVKVIIPSKEKEPEKPTPEPPPLHPLQVFIRDKLPNVSKLRYQLTSEEAERLVQDFDKVKIRDMLETMENYKPLLQKNQSVNLTIRKWFRRDLERNSNGTNTQTKQFNSTSPPSNDGRIRTYNDRVNLNTGELLEISRAQRRQLAEQMAADKAANG